MKKCNYCKTDKELSAFGIDRRNKSGLNSKCKACASHYAKTHVPLTEEDRLAAASAGPLPDVSALPLIYVQENGKLADSDRALLLAFITSNSEWTK